MMRRVWPTFNVKAVASVFQFLLPVPAAILNSTTFEVLVDVPVFVEVDVFVTVLAAVFSIGFAALLFESLSSDAGPVADDSDASLPLFSSSSSRSHLSRSPDNARS